MKNIHFIVNPIAGKGGAVMDMATLSKYFDQTEYQITLKVSDYAGHATKLTKASLNDGAKIIVACGGDGTINEVASCLVHTNVLLGIVPMGSGNGLAESLKIPRNIKKVVQVIKGGKTNRIDVAMVNGRPFFSNMGIGFDAKVISNYNSCGQRRLWAYLKAVIKSIKDFKNNERIKVELNGKTYNTNPFMFFVSNSKVMGYDISLTRMASLQDGLLDVVIIDNLTRGEILVLGFFVLLRLNQYLKKVKYFKVKELKLAFEEKCADRLMQADGELHHLNESELCVTIEERALSVLVP
ncbi:diacylglycerol/lipid kinase family protein [Flagellimonas profundi]|uniref:Diacylglycerol kinase family lipid kinase n=1 Tax=Flagellimonas profundi TaxID=2915620 RepID=A0ABS3FGY0_9FLAO|nr:diacylglycerol kinase family protein [Allomuricauda profundi]MBO0342424.1 diacylglycerol kinase family lipid kinase [Allomuricauda profundi]